MFTKKKKNHNQIRSDFYTIELGTKDCIFPLYFHSWISCTFPPARLLEQPKTTPTIGLGWIGYV